MIVFFNKLGKSWAAKLILALLALSMIAISGVGGLFNTSVRRDNALKVGGETLSIQQLLASFEAERQQLSRLTGKKYISPAQALQLGLLETVVQKEVNKKISALIQKKLGLTASNAAVRKYVERHPAFTDALGRFDRNIFYAYLSQMRMSEAELARQLQNELAMNHLARAVRGVAYAPPSLAALAYKYENEKRDIAAVLIRADKITLTEKPTEAALKEYYEAYAENFALPEYRGWSVVRITPEMVADKVAVSEEELDALFEEQQAQLIIPEKRRLDQMRFDDEAAAQAAKEGLTPDNFRQRAEQKLGQTDTQTDFGFVSQNELLEELAEPVFQARKGALVGPIESPLGWHILLVREIQAAQTPDIAAVKKELRQRIAQEKAYDMLYDVVKQAEDILGAGDTLEHAAKQLNLKIEHIAQADITGRRPDGTVLPEPLNNAELLQSLFSLQKGDSTPLIESGTGYLVAHLESVTPVSHRSFAAVQEELKRLWTTEKRQEKLQLLSAQLVERTAKGNALAAQGAFGHLDILSTKGATRAQTGKIPAEAAEVLFRQKKGLENVRAIPVPQGILVAATDAVYYPQITADDKGFQEFQETFALQVGEELAADTLAAYATDFGVKIYENSIKKAFAAYLSNE